MPHMALGVLPLCDNEYMVILITKEAMETKHLSGLVLSNWSPLTASKLIRGNCYRQTRSRVRIWS